MEDYNKTETKTYNPWPRFMLFYVIAALHVVVTNSAIYLYKMSDTCSNLLNMVFYLILFALPVIMILHKKENHYIPIKTIFNSILLMGFVYALTTLGFLYFMEDQGDDISGMLPIILFSILIGCFLYASLCYLIVWLVIKYY